MFKELSSVDNMNLLKGDPIEICLFEMQLFFSVYYLSIFTSNLNTRH